MDTDPTGGFRKLNFLLSQPPFPRETFPNLLRLYCKPQHPFHDLAADVMAENPEYVSSLLGKVGGGTGAVALSEQQLRMAQSFDGR